MPKRSPVQVPAGREAAFAERLARATSIPRRSLALVFSPSRASSADLLVEGAHFYPAMLRDIATATDSIHIIQYGFKPGEVGEQFAAALSDKARAGVAVRLLVDGHGSAPHGMSTALYRDLHAAGVQIGVTTALRLRAARALLGRTQSAHWNLDGIGRIDHRKLLVIDGRIGWVGGAGFENHFLDGRFHDLFVRVEGPVVQQLQLTFLASFRRQGGAYSPAELPALFPTLPAASDAVPAIALHNAPDARPLSAAILHLIDSATHSLEIVNPYLSDHVVIQRLRAAAQRGVRVRLLVPARSNNHTSEAARLHYQPAMLADGIEIWGHPAMVHAKALVRDGHDVLAGTCNLEVWSLRRFYELNLRIDSPDLARQFSERLFEPDFAISERQGPPAGALQRVQCAGYARLWPLV